MQPRPQALTKPPHHQLIVGYRQDLAGEASRLELKNKGELKVSMSVNK